MKQLAARFKFLSLPEITPVSPWGIGFGLVVAIALGIVIEVLLLDLTDALGLYGPDPTTNLADLVFRVVATVLQLSVILVLIRFIYKINPIRALNFRRPTRTQTILLVKVFAAYLAGLLLVIAPLMTVLLSPELLEQTQDIGLQTSGLPLNEVLLTGLILVVLVPLLEEIVYRGILFRGLAKVMPGLGAALLTSGLFALLHLQVNVAIDTFFLSLLLCLVYARTQNLWMSIGLHALKNGLAFSLLVSGVA